MTSFEAEVNIPEKIADEPRDFSQPGEWEPQSFHATGTCILSDASPISKMLKQWKKREHQNIKQLLWAVTHGYTVHFKFIVKDKHGRMHQDFYQVDRPRKLKALLRAINVIPQYIIVDRQGNAVRNAAENPNTSEMVCSRRSFISQRDCTCVRCACISCIY